MDQLFAVKYSYLIPLLPLIGACIAGLLGAKWLKGMSHWPIWLGVGASALISFSLLFGMIHNSGQTETIVPAQAGQEAKIEEGYKSLSVTKLWYVWAKAGDDSNKGIAAPHRPTFFRADAAAFFDPLSAVMLCVVTGIGFLITVFSAGYMRGESGYFRFFAYLGLFIFAMTILVMGENLVMLYLGWEGVGLCSYLLIGYYYERPSAREAAKKAFIVNRVGDFGFGIGIMLCFLVYGTVSYYGDSPATLTGVLTRAADPNFYAHLLPWQQTCVFWIPFCLMLGAFGKSAQFPLYVWLPDAMEGPTPVSALIHAATMVTAGIYMIVRCGSLFFGNEAALITIAVIGAFTALLAATIALRQFDLKKVFAYSTISQLGYMFVGVGVLAPVAGMFHLVTHAFFKALLFLSSGVVMHAMAGELDMRKMSGLKRVLPLTHIVMLIGCLALAGCPPFSGFFSKDEIVGAAFSRSIWLGLIMLFTSFLTAYYTFRLYFRVFQGPLVVPEAPAPAHAHGHESHEHATASDSAIQTGTAPSSGVDVAQAHHGAAGVHDQAHGHGHDDHHNHEPMIMMFPLILLAIGAALGGLFMYREALANFLGLSPSLALGLEVARHAKIAGLDHAKFGIEFEGAAHSSAIGGMLMGTLAFLAGISLAYLMHLKDRPMADRVANAFGPLTRIVEHKFYVDEIYQACIIEPLRTSGKIFFAFDRFIVDGIINMLGWIPQLTGFTLKLTVQRGYLQGYATTMLFGIMVILVIIFLR
jgi:NADH-quinone oxidoreductase subunit L